MYHIVVVILCLVLFHAKLSNKSFFLYFIHVMFSFHTARFLAFEPWYNNNNRLSSIFLGIFILFCKSGFLKKKSCYCDRKIIIVVVMKKLKNVAHYSKSTWGINTKLGIHAHVDKVQLQYKGHNSESCSFALVPHAVLLI